MVEGRLTMEGTNSEAWETVGLWPATGKSCTCPRGNVQVGRFGMDIAAGGRAVFPRLGVEPTESIRKAPLRPKDTAGLLSRD